MSDDKTIITDGLGIASLLQPKKKSACFIQYSGGGGMGKRYLLDTIESTIGRAPTATIYINDAGVSRQHAKCIQSADKIEIEDLGSSNGTFVNDQKISSRTNLRDGDMVRFGTVMLKFFSHDNAENALVDEIYRRSIIDAGTQIFNKRYIIETLDTEFKASKTYEQRPLSVILFDLDFFKKMNDQNGHNAGDFILKEVAQLAKSAMRKDDTVGRFGGEEFCAILPNTDARAAYDLADRVRSAIDAHIFDFEGKKLKQTISAGVSQLLNVHQSPTELLEDADKKLYKSKHEGRNRVTI